MQATTLTPHCRDMVWLKNRVITKMTLAQIARNESHRTRHQSQPSPSYLSRRINRLAEAISDAVTKQGRTVTCTTLNLTINELDHILDYTRSSQRARLGGDVTL